MKSSVSASTPVASSRLVTIGAALDELFRPCNRSDAPGLVVGVARDGRVLYRRAFGLASVELGVANTPRTRMRIGSTSKHFTSLAALLLAEEGKLDLDAGVRRYVPELPALEGEATLRQLMTHTGGHRCYLDLSFLSDGIAIKPAGSALASLVRQGSANFPPGERMIYCNSGYHLLSLAIERAAGVPFERVLAERIFEPLGMRDTESVPSDFVMRPGVAALHVALPDGSYRRGIFPSEEIRGEGGIVSTVDDMLLWLAHLRGAKRVGSEASWGQLLTPGRLNNGTPLPYSLGLIRENYRGVEIIHHAGSVVGGSAQMLTAPSYGLDVVIVTNGTTANPVELAYSVVDVVLGDTALGRRATPPATGAYQALVGRRYYGPKFDTVIEFADLEGKLGLSLFNQVARPLRLRGDGLWLDVADIAMGPVVVRTGPLAATQAAPGQLSSREGGHEEMLELLPDQAPPVADLAPALSGTYLAPDLAARAAVIAAGDVLLLQLVGTSGSLTVKLVPYSADVLGFEVPGGLLPFRGVVCVERTGALVTGLRLSTARTRRLRLQRASG
jgi:D-aminopeptidase